VVWARRAIADAERTNTLPALAHALRLIEVCLEDLGDPDRMKYRARALPIYEALDDQVGLADELSNLGSFALFDGRFEESLDLFERSRRARERSGDVMGEAIEISNIGEVLLEQYRGDEARDYIERARRIMQSAEYPMGMAVVVGNLGRAVALAGDVDQGCDLLDDAIARATAIHAAFLVNELNVRKLEILVASGRDDDARVLAAGLAAFGTGDLQEQHFALLARLQAWLALRADDVASAADHVETALKFLAEATTVDRVLTLRARAEISRRRGDPASAAADDTEADRLLAVLGVTSVPSL
jgi:ATP/maltotriose-dependent transcriptional regulator MalT